MPRIQDLTVSNLTITPTSNTEISLNVSFEVLERRMESELG